MEKLPFRLSLGAWCTSKSGEARWQALRWGLRRNSPGEHLRCELGPRPVTRSFLVSESDGEGPKGHGCTDLSKTEASGISPASPVTPRLQGLPPLGCGGTGLGVFLPSVTS